jgi:hypothetical protein
MGRAFGPWAAGSPSGGAGSPSGGGRAVDDGKGLFGGLLDELRADVVKHALQPLAGVFIHFEEPEAEADLDLDEAADGLQAEGGLVDGEGDVDLGVRLDAVWM